MTVEVDWDTRNSPGGFQPDDQLDCAPPLPEDLDYPVPCEASSPVFDQPGTAQVAIRVTDTVDGTQATATQPLVVAAARGARARVPGQRGSTPDLCAPASPACSAGPATAARPRAAATKVPHNGWPAVTGILWKVLDSSGRKKVGGAANDELLGHHGSDRIFGGAGNDILWGDWDPANNNTHQKDVLDGGPGNDWLYPSHGATVVKGGAGKDYVWAYYGRGTIDCGPGQDTARVKLNGPWKLRNCERVLHFCAFGSDGHGGCLKPGEKRKGIRSRPGVRSAPALTRAWRRAPATTGSEPAGPSIVSVTASGSSRSCMRRNAQQRLSAATNAATRSRVPGRWAEAQDGVGRLRLGGHQVARDGGYLREARGHLGLGQRAGDGWFGWSWEDRRTFKST